MTTLVMTSLVNNQDQDDTFRQFELYDEMDAPDTCSVEDDMGSYMLHGLDFSNYSSVSVYSAMSIASNKCAGDPEIAGHFRKCVCAENTPLYTLTEANLERVNSGSLRSFRGHERCFGSSDGTCSQSSKALRLELSPGLSTTC